MLSHRSTLIGRIRTHITHASGAASALSIVLYDLFAFVINRQRERETERTGEKEEK